MKTFDCVVAADEADGIGKDNDLPWPRLPTDLRHFRAVTSRAAPGRRNAVIMGRRTWDSVPPKYRPLPERWNVIVSRGAPATAGDAAVAGSLDEALAMAAAAPDVDGVFVIGGGQLFAQAFAHPACRDVVLTRIAARFDCDAHIPDVRDGFERIEVGPTIEENGLAFAMERWRKRGA